jgi:hypothetical protein
MLDETDVLDAQSVPGCEPDGLSQPEWVPGQHNSPFQVCRVAYGHARSGTFGPKQTDETQAAPDRPSMVCLCD